MLQLYSDPTCGFCQRVLQFLEAENIAYELRQISLWQHSDIKQELMDRGGKGQVPYLVDTKRGVEMYESAAILAHLKEHYAS